MSNLVKLALLLIWTYGAVLLLGFSLARKEFCGSEVAFHLAYLGWPIAALFLAFGDEVEVPPCVVKN